MITSWTIVAGIGAALLAAFGAWMRHLGKNASDAKHAKKEADAYEKHIQDIARAAGAQPRGGVSDDPYNRDR